MYEHCPICDSHDIRKTAQHSGYSSFVCEDCGYQFDIDDCYLDFDYNEDGYKDADEEDW